MPTADPSDDQACRSQDLPSPAWPRDPIGLGLLLMSLLLLALLMDRDYEFSLEPDSQFVLIDSYARFFSTLDLSELPIPMPHPYLDGSQIVYGLLAAVIAASSTAFDALDQLLTGDESAVLLSIQLTNVVARAIATWVFFGALRLLGVGRAVSVVLALLLCLSPQLLQIHLARVDQLMILPLVVVMYTSLRIALGRDSRGTAVLLGLAMALLLNTKISGGVFGLLPALACGSILLARPNRQTLARLTHTAVLACLVFVSATVPLLTRFLVYLPGDLVSHLLVSVELVQSWTPLLGRTPLLYYNVDLFTGYGWPFLFLVGGSILWVSWQAVTQRDPACMYLVGATLVFSVLGMLAFKYERGGYHLVPLYLACLGLATCRWSSVLAKRWVPPAWRPTATVAVAITLLTPPSLTVARDYLGWRLEAAERPAGIDATRRQPRNWISHQVPAGSIVCFLRHSEWASVPVQHLGLKVRYGPLDLPYLDAESMAEYPVPTPEQVAEECRVVLLNDYHLRFFEDAFRRFGLEQRWQEWQALFEQLGTLYERRVYRFHRPVYYVSTSFTFVLRTTSDREPRPRQ